MAPIWTLTLLFAFELLFELEFEFELELEFELEFEFEFEFEFVLLMLQLPQLAEDAANRTAANAAQRIRFMKSPIVNEPDGDEW